MGIEERKCVECGKILHGRTDQRFCADYCRNAYHNRFKRPDEQYIKEVNGRIRRNRRILKELCPEGKAMVRREVLEIKGYDYRYFSAIYTAKKTYFLCYDYGFAPIIDNGKEKVLIIHKQNYMDQYVLNPWASI